MTMMTFRPSVSMTRGVPIVEVWWGDRFIATICPPPEGSDLAAFSIVSKHINAVVHDKGEPQAVVIGFDLK
jgi:hypothetical protein